MQPSAAPSQCQHCADGENFTIHAAQSLACGAVEHKRRGGLLRRCSSQAPTMMNISPLMQLSASRTQLQSTNAEACCLDTAAPGSDDGPVCCPSPRLWGEDRHPRAQRGQRVAEDRVEGRSSESVTAALASHPPPYQVRGRLFGQLLTASGKRKTSKATLSFVIEMHWAANPVSLCRIAS